jgi:formate-dependent nitrite reductase membrane component NrfD
MSISPDASFKGASSGNGVLAPSATYYEQPMLKKPHWEWQVISYLFLGGVMGGCGILVAIADERDEDDVAIARSARHLAFVLAATCPLVLIAHLGRPERFHHMLRVVKFKSVMSMGVWGLIAFSVPAGIASIGQLSRDGVLPGWMKHLAPRAITNPLQGVLGAFIGGYTGVLLSSTAIPLWGKGKSYIPAFSVCSGVAGACAANAAILAMTGGSARARQKLERLELVASLAELALLEGFRRHAGAIGEPMFGGARGRKLRNVTQLAGIVGAGVLNLLPSHAKAKTLLASALTLAGGYVLRETLIESGKDSADDPRAASRQPE